MLFTTNVAAILASGIVVMALYRVRRASGRATAAVFGYRGDVAVIAVLLLAVIAPVWISSDRIYTITVRQNDAQAVAEHWASDAGWSVTGVTATGRMPVSARVDDDVVLIAAIAMVPARICRTAGRRSAGTSGHAEVVCSMKQYVQADPQAATTWLTGSAQNLEEPVALPAAAFM